jgi:PrtD family type I secretion system ABC transporter
LTTLRQFVAGSGIHAFFDVPWAPIYLVVISLLHPWLGVFSLFAMLVLCLIAWLNEIFTHATLEASNQEAQKAHLFASNNMRGVETLSALGMLNKVRQRWGKHQERVLVLQMQASERAGNFGSLSKTLRIAFQSLILGLGAWLAIEEIVSPGAMIAASILMGRALAPVDQIIGVWRQWLGAKAAFERLDKLVKDFPPAEPHVALPRPAGDVVIEGASVVPPGCETQVFKNLSFRIPAGEVIGVIGPSGAGKSSLARLLVGVWPCREGNARLDGASIHDWPKEELGPHLGYLPQDIALFEGTVAENIARYGELDSDKIISAAKAAGVHDMILRLPAGYQTPVGVDGGALSGGQRQRIALARALYGDPCVIVLDEPNSNLDDVGEIALVEAIRQAKQRGATVVFISHNKRLIGVAEKLLVLREGALYAYGPQQQVLNFLQQGQTPGGTSAPPAEAASRGQS